VLLRDATNVNTNNNNNLNNYVSDKASFENEEDSKSSDHKEQQSSKKIKIKPEHISFKEIKDEDFFNDPSNYNPNF